MRALLFSIPVVALSACGVAPTQQTSAQQAAAATVEAAVEIPMDPGTLQCVFLSNSNALAAATEWAMGRARAAALSGRISNVPDQASVTSGLANHCGSNPNDTVRQAAAQIGF